MPNQLPVGDAELTRSLGKFWTVANMLSLVRLVLVVPITHLILTSGPRDLLFGLITVGVVTDWLDGRLARWSKTVSEWGKVLDPLADKAAAGFIVMALVLRPEEPRLPFWFLALIVSRDVLIVLGGAILARRTRQVVMSAWSGKLAVTGISLTVLAALLQADPPIMRIGIWATTALLVYSFVIYLIRYLRMTREVDRTPRSGEPSSVDELHQRAESLG